MPPTLSQLTAPRSQLSQVLEAYLQSFVDLSAWDAAPPAFLFLPKGMPPDTGAVSLYQSPSVVNLKDLNSEKNRLRVELDARGEFGRGRDTTPAIPWTQEREASGWIVILGRPGEGKTLLTRLTCRDVSETSLELLRTRARSLGGIPVPIWLRFEDLLSATRLDASHQDYDRDPFQAAVNVAVRQRIAAAVEHYFRGRIDPPSSTLAFEHIRSRARQGSTWLFIDASDEADPALGDVGRRAALRSLCDLPESTHVVMTCRKHDYDRRRMVPDGLAHGRLREYDLEPLTRAQQGALVNRWFGPTSVEARDVLALIRSHSQFQDMASNAMMLTLICATRERHTVGPNTRRVHLYDLILRDIVSRARKSSAMPPNDPEIDWRLHVLREATWTLFTGGPEGASIDAVQWKLLLVRECARLEINASSLEQDLRREGLIVSHRAGALRFLHRSFVEYLAGARIASRGPDELESAIRRNVTDQSWRHVLVLAFSHFALAATGPERPEAVRDAAGGLVNRIIAAPPGPAGVAIALIADAVVDAGSDSVPSDTLRRLRSALLRLMRADAVVPPTVRAAAGSALGRLGDDRFHAEDVWCLPKLRSDFSADGHLATEPLLGFVEIPEGEFWMGSDEQ